LRKKKQKEGETGQTAQKKIADPVWSAREVEILFTAGWEIQKKSTGKKTRKGKVSKNGSKKVWKSTTTHRKQGSSKKGGKKKKNREERKRFSFQDEKGESFSVHAMRVLTKGIRQRKRGKKTRKKRVAEIVVSKAGTSLL